LAKITVTEHRRLLEDANGRACVLEAPHAVQTGLTAPNASSAQTVAAQTGSKFLRICSDVALHVGLGATATTDDMLYGPYAEIVLPISRNGQLSYLAG
jgi:hypothetical protein